MKKSLCIAFAVLLVVSCISFAFVLADNTPALSVSSVSAKAGDRVDVVLSVASNAELAGLECEIDYDSNNLELVSAVSTNEVFPIDTFHSSENYSVNPYYLSWDNSLNEAILANGNLATLTFEVKQNAYIGTYDITPIIEDGGAFDDDLKSVTFNANAGAITVTDGLAQTTTSLPTTNSSTGGTQNGLSVVYTMDEGSRVAYFGTNNATAQNGTSEYYDLNGNNVLKLAIKNDQITFIQLPSNWAVKENCTPKSLSFQIAKDTGSVAIKKGCFGTSKSATTNAFVTSTEWLSPNFKTYSIKLTEDMLSNNYICLTGYTTVSPSHFYVDNITVEFESNVPNTTITTTVAPVTSTHSVTSVATTVASTTQKATTVVTTTSTTSKNATTVTSTEKATTNKATTVTSAVSPTTQKVTTVVTTKTPTTPKPTTIATTTLKVVTTVVPTTSKPSDVIYGDCNKDAKINMADVLLLRKYLAKWDVTIDSVTSDCNADGKINMADVLLLRKYLAKWSVILGPSEK